MTAWLLAEASRGAIPGPPEAARLHGQCTREYGGLGHFHTSCTPGCSTSGTGRQRLAPAVCRTHLQAHILPGSEPRAQCRFG